MSTRHLHPPDAPYQWPFIAIPRHVQAALFLGVEEVYGWSKRRQDRQRRLTWASEVLGRPVATFAEIDPDEFGALVAELRRDGWRR